MNKLTLTPLPNIPLIRPGDNLAELILGALRSTNISLENDDILVVAQKIVSKAEGRAVNLAEIHPSQEALEMATRSAKDPRIVELILRESNNVLRVRPGTIVVEHRLGFICASAGIDHSNVGSDEQADPCVLLLPVNPDESAAQIRKQLETLSGKKLGVLIIGEHAGQGRVKVDDAVEKRG